MKIADFYDVTIDYLIIGSTKKSNNLTDPTSEEEREFLDWVKNNLEGTFFYDFSKSPEEQKREMMRGLRLIYEMEKGRKKE